MKKMLILAITIILFGALSAVASAQTDKAEVFISDSCEFCENVKEHVVENEIEDSANFEYVDIGTETGRTRYDARIIECKIPDYDQGVPMIYSYGDCRVTDGSVIDELDRRAGINKYEVTDIQEDGQSLAETLEPEDIPLPSAGSVLLMLTIPALFIGSAIFLIRRFKL